MTASLDAADKPSRRANRKQNTSENKRERTTSRRGKNAIATETGSKATLPGKSNEKRRSRRKGKAKSPGNAEKKASGYSPAILRLNGSFEFSLGDGKVMRGEGDIEIELDQATIASLKNMVDAKWNETMPVVKNVAGVITRLPEILKMTESLLNRLADPATQENLKRADQLLELLGKLPAGSAKKEVQ